MCLKFSTKHTASGIEYSNLFHHIGRNYDNKHFNLNPLKSPEMHQEILSLHVDTNLKGWEHMLKALFLNNTSPEKRYTKLVNTYNTKPPQIFCYISQWRKMFIVAVHNVIRAFRLSDLYIASISDYLHIIYIYIERERALYIYVSVFNHMLNIFAWNIFRNWHLYHFSVISYTLSDGCSRNAGGVEGPTILYLAHVVYAKTPIEKR